MSQIYKQGIRVSPFTFSNPSSYWIASLKTHLWHILMSELSQRVLFFQGCENGSSLTVAAPDRGENLFLWNSSHSVNLQDRLNPASLHKTEQTASDRSRNTTQRCNCYRRLQIKTCNHKCRISACCLKCHDRNLGQATGRTGDCQLANFRVYCKSHGNVMSFVKCYWKWRLWWFLHTRKTWGLSLSLPRRGL